MKKKYERLMFWFPFVIAALTFTAVVVLVIMQVYIRWSMNQNFAFLPGFGLEALVLSVFALISVMAYRYGASANE